MGSETIAACDREVVVAKTETTTPGNNAKMREALLDSTELLQNLGVLLGDDLTSKQICANNAALAEPPRNCEQCQTADEAVALAVDAGVADCAFGAREMAKFLLAEAKGGAE